MRKYLAFLLLGILTLVGAGGAAVGAVQSQSGTALSQAVKNTLGATNYTEDLVEKTPQGNQSAHLVYQAPDRLGGWLLSGRSQDLPLHHRDHRVHRGQPVGLRPDADDLLHAADHRRPGGRPGAHVPARTTTRASPPGTDRSPRSSSTQGSQKETLTYTVTGNYVSDVQRRPRRAARSTSASRTSTRPRPSSCPRATRPRPRRPRRADPHPAGSARSRCPGTPVTGPRRLRRQRRPGARRSGDAASGRPPWGSSASTSQRTTTKWRAPAAMRSPTQSGSTPPVTHTGQGERRTASDRYPVPVPGRPGLVGVGTTGPADR